MTTPLHIDSTNAVLLSLSMRVCHSFISPPVSCSISPFLPRARDRSFVLYSSLQMTLMSSLQTRLRNFRGHLEAEEKASVKVRGLNVPQY